MNTFFKVIAWFGLVLFSLGAIIAFYGSTVFLLAEPGEIGVLFEYMFAMWFGIPGIVFMIIGGLISKPRKFWLVCIVAGLFYIVSFFEIYLGFPGRIHSGQTGFMLKEISFSILPGLVAILEGIWLRRKDTNSNGRPLFDGTA